MFASCDDLRTSKTVDGVTTNYYYDGSLLVAEQSDSETIIYIYDANGSPVGFQYRNSTYAEKTFDTYWYEKDMFGNIVGVYNKNGVKLVSYEYNAWGICYEQYYNGGANTSVVKNPYTYRGYYYDTDLGLYYLQSRYYDPNTCRFINADCYLSTGQGLLGYNMFAYCGNNPVMRVDPNGEGWIGSMFSTIKETVENIIATAIENGSRIVDTVKSCFEPSTEQIQNAVDATDYAKTKERFDENGEIVTVNIHIQTQATMDAVDLIAYSYYYDALYKKYLDEADSLGVSHDKLMTKEHICWELQVHMIGQLLGHSSADPADLNIGESWQTIIERIS